MRTCALLFAAALALLPGAVHAHGGHFEAGGEALLAWNLHPLVLAPLIAGALLYAHGYSVIRRKRDASRYRRPATAYFAGIVLIAVALVSPLDHMSEVSVSAHMVQHMLLVQVAAPLLVLGSPAVVLLAATRGARGWVKRLRRHGPLKAAAKVLLAPVAVLVLHAVTLLGWHLPRLYNEALTVEVVHFAQHSAFLVTGVLFWQVVLPSMAHRPGLWESLGLLFVITVVTGGLGALLTLSPAPWYAYPGDSAFLSALEDQQLAGALMWVVGAMLYMLAAAWAFISTMNRLEQPAPSRRVQNIVREGTL